MTKPPFISPFSGVGEGRSLESLHRFIYCRAGMLSDEKLTNLGANLPQYTYNQEIHTTLSFCRVFYLVKFKAKGFFASYRMNLEG